MPEKVRIIARGLGIKNTFNRAQLYWLREIGIPAAIAALESPDNGSAEESNEIERRLADLEDVVAKLAPAAPLGESLTAYSEVLRRSMLRRLA